MERVEYNRLSRELREEFEWDTPMAQNDSVTFVALGAKSMAQRKLLSGKYEPVPIHKASLLIPAADIIYDEFKDNGKDRDGNAMPLGGNVDIGVPVMWNSEKLSYLFDVIEFTKGNKNVITISGKEPHKRHIINYLRACNYNRSNERAIPHAGVGFLFEEVKTFARAKDRMRNEREQSQAKALIIGMTQAELAMQMSVMNIALQRTTEENQIALIDFIASPANLKKFLGQAVDNRTPVRHVIQQSVDLEFITYEPIAKIWSYTQNKKIICQCTPGADPYEHLMTYFFTNKHGSAHLEALESKIAKDAADKALEYSVKKTNSIPEDPKPVTEIKIEKITKSKKADEVPVAGD